MRKVAEGRYVVGSHTSERLEVRSILKWQAVALNHENPW